MSDGTHISRKTSEMCSARHLPLETVRDLVQRHIQGRQFGFLGEERVNVLLLNMDLLRADLTS